MTENMIPTAPQTSTPQSSSQPASRMPLLLGILAVLAVGAFVALQMSANKPTPQPALQPATELEAEEAVMDHGSMVPVETQGAEEEVVSEESAVSIEVEGGSFYYNPNVIRVKQGATVTVTLNSADMMHDFVIDELNVRSAIIPAGRSTTVTFTADEVGEFEFYCSVSDHRVMGMVGTLIVEE